MILKQDHQGALNQLHESNERAMIEMSEQYKAKLIVEYQKYSSLEEMYTSIKKSYDKKMGAVEKATKVTNSIKTISIYLNFVGGLARKFSQWLGYIKFLES